MADEMPPANLMLQALHAIKASIDQTNQRLDQTNQRLDGLTVEVRHLGTRVDETNERLENLRTFTVQKLTDLNAKVDETNQRLGRLETSHRVLNERFDHFLTGEGAQLVKRVTKLEVELDAVKAKLHS